MPIAKTHKRGSTICSIHEYLNNVNNASYAKSNATMRLRSESPNPNWAHKSDTKNHKTRSMTGKLPSRVRLLFSLVRKACMMKVIYYSCMYAKNAYDKYKYCIYGIVIWMELFGFESVNMTSHMWRKHKNCTTVNLFPFACSGSRRGSRGSSNASASSSRSNRSNTSMPLQEQQQHGETQPQQHHHHHQQQPTKQQHVRAQITNVPVIEVEVVDPKAWMFEIAHR